MPYSFQLHTATAGQQNFSFSQIDGFVTTADLRVYVNGTLQSTSGVYTINTATSNIQFISGRTAGDVVLIRRFTAALKADREVDFDDGSILTAADLDNSALQLLYLVQEGLDEAKEFCLRLNSNLTNWDAISKKITNLSTPTVATDAATKAYVDAAAFGSVSGAANLVFATPNGTSGTVALRALVDVDIPSLLASKISNFDTQVRTSRLDQMAAPTASVSMNSQKIINVLNPTDAQDAATKNYCDITFLNPDPQVYTSTYSSGSYSNTSNIVTNLATGGNTSQLRLNLSVLPVRRLCVVDGIVGPFNGTATGPHWFSVYNSTGAAIRIRIYQAHFDWVANKSPWAGLNPQAPNPWETPWKSPNKYNEFAAQNPFTSSVAYSDGLYTVAAGADFKFWRDEGASPTYWTTGSHTDGLGQATAVTGGIGPVVAATIVNGVREGTYARIAMTLIRMT
jgi:hypothetical protein